MSSDTTLKMSKGKMSNGKHVELNKSYELLDGRVGTVKYIGKATFRAGVEWIGMEITKGAGKNNGSVQGVSYFSCDKKGQGAFVQIEKIKKVSSGKKGKTVKSTAKKEGAIETGKIDYDAAEFKVDTSGGDFLGEKVATPTAVKKGEVQKKDGAIATGRNDDYDAAKFENAGKQGSFLDEKVAEATDVKKGDVQKKDGAIATGRNDDFETYKEEPKDPQPEPLSDAEPQAAEPEPLPMAEQDADPQPEPLPAVDSD